MKKTSVFFLVFALILIIAGLIIRGCAIKQAEKENIKLFKQELTKENDLVETVVFSPENINKININLNDTDINIIGNSDKCYVELINFNALEYSTYTNNRVLTIENDFISTIIGRAEGGNINFNGVRDYLRFEKHNKDKKINIHLTSDAVIKIFDISIDDGNIKISDISTESDYIISVDKGNVNFNNTPEISLIEAKIKKGNIKLDNCYLTNAKLQVENGNLDFSTPSNLIYNYDIKAETGDIKLNDETHKGVYVYAPENTTFNGYLKATVGVGNISIKTIDIPTDSPNV